VLGFLIWNKIGIWRNIIAYYRGLASLVISKITMQREGEFGTTRLITKAQQSLGASQMSFFFFFFLLIFNYFSWFFHFRVF
jgi:hypothetical protein